MTLALDTVDTMAGATDPLAAPLVARLVTQHGATGITRATLDAFVGGDGDRVLFFHGDPVRFPEVLDVAVVLPELQRAFPGRFRVGVVARAEEDAIAARFAVDRWPSLLFLRGGRYVTVVAGMLDWTDYLARVADALAMPAGRVPGVGIPVVASGGAAAPACR